jgi:hypothetical protein
MKPAEIVAVAVAIPMIVALIAAEVAAGHPAAPPSAPRVAEASDLAPAFFDEIVVVAKRATDG